MNLISNKCYTIYTFRQQHQLNTLPSTSTANISFAGINLDASSSVKQEKKNRYDAEQKKNIERCM